MKVNGIVRNSSVTRAVRDTFDGRILRNASMLYASQFLTYLLPLALVPYLARVLGPETWGMIILVQAIGTYLHLLVDYHSEIAASRHVANARNDKLRLSEIAAGVLGVRLTLAIVAVALVGLIHLVVPVFTDLGWLLWLGAFWFIGMAFRPIWYFLGVERLGRFLAVELSLRLAAVIAILWFVGNSSDAWLVLFLQGMAFVLSAIIGLMMLYREVPFSLPSVTQTRRTLSDGWNLFVYRVFSDVYSNSNTVILGILASPIYAAWYGAAERLINILISLMYPLIRALYPRASRIAHEDPEKASRLTSISTILIVTTALVVSVIGYFAAPTVIWLLLGPGYEETIGVLRILLLLLPIVGISQSLSLQWIIPFGLESHLKRITVGIALFHVPLAIILGSQFQHVGIAWALVITDSVFTGSLLVLLFFRSNRTLRVPTQQVDPSDRAQECFARGD